MSKINKVVSLIVIMLFVTISFQGCFNKKIEAYKAGTPEEAMNLFNQYNLDGNMEEMVKLYSDVYVDSVGYDRNQMLKILKRNGSGGVVSKSETISIEDVNDNIKKAVVSITSKEKDKDEVTKEYVYAVIKEGSGWAVSPDGVYKCKNYDIPQKVKGEVNFNLAKEITALDSTITRINLINDSKKQIVFGKEGNYSKVVVETTEGTYEMVIEQIVPVNKRTQTYFMTKINGLEGEIKKVTVTSIYDGDGKGNSIEGTEKDYTAYTK